MAHFFFIIRTCAGAIWRDHNFIVFFVHELLATVNSFLKILTILCLRIVTPAFKSFADSNHFWSLLSISTFFSLGHHNLIQLLKRFFFCARWNNKMNKIRSFSYGSFLFSFWKFSIQRVKVGPLPGAGSTFEMNWFSSNFRISEFLVSNSVDTKSVRPFYSRWTQ